eukprot:2854568-Rhodomonas_salina.3
MARTIERRARDEACHVLACGADVAVGAWDDRGPDPRGDERGGEPAPAGECTKTGNAARAWGGRKGREWGRGRQSWCGGAGRGGKGSVVRGDEGRRHPRRQLERGRCRDVATVSIAVSTVSVTAEWGALGQGEPGMKGAGAGHLYVQVQIQPHPRFQRNGYDVHVTVPITISQVPPRFLALLTRFLGSCAHTRQTHTRNRIPGTSCTENALPCFLPGSLACALARSHDLWLVRLLASALLPLRGCSNVPCSFLCVPCAPLSRAHRRTLPIGCAAFGRRCARQRRSQRGAACVDSPEH